MADKDLYITVGRRKTSTSRVRLKRGGTGQITVNKRALGEYFNRESHQTHVKQALALTDNLDKFDVVALVNGGGITGQAGALRHGIARALLEADPELRTVLKRNGLLTRDPRMKERKKPGQKGARARFQFSKR